MLNIIWYYWYDIVWYITICSSNISAIVIFNFTINSSPDVPVLDIIQTHLSLFGNYFGEPYDLFPCKNPSPFETFYPEITHTLSTDDLELEEYTHTTIILSSSTNFKWVVPLNGLPSIYHSTVGVGFPTAVQFTVPDSPTLTLVSNGGLTHVGLAGTKRRNYYHVAIYI